jgi:hypothetical protein
MTMAASAIVMVARKMVMGHLLHPDDPPGVVHGRRGLHGSASVPATSTHGSSTSASTRPAERPAALPALVRLHLQRLDELALRMRLERPHEQDVPGIIQSSVRISSA